MSPSTTSASATEVRLSKAAELRRSTKPIMEKRRRARINHSLMELKTLILDALKKDHARHNKLEKADILEMTVKHLQTLKRHQVASKIASDVSISDKFRAGYTECVSEVGRYLSRVDGLDTSVRQCLLNHLGGCMQSLPPTPSSPNTMSQVPKFFNGLPLVPTRLPTGEIALVLPSGIINTEPLSVFTNSQVPVMSSGVMSPAASERSSISPMSSYSSSDRPSSADIKCEEDVWRPW